MRIAIFWGAISSNISYFVIFLHKFCVLIRIKYSKPNNNRRFGGDNDLVSLGQIMYFMATGDQLFFDRFQKCYIALVYF
jgi:hypothetical protein